MTRDWKDIPDTESSPGAADKWWDKNATDREKQNLAWIRANASVAHPELQVGHDGLVVRRGSVLPEWQYRLKYPKKNKVFNRKPKGYK